MQPLRAAAISADIPGKRRHCRAYPSAHRRRPAHAANPQWVAALRAAAQATLGADAQLSEHPSGGVVAEAGQRCIDLSLAGIAARVLDDTAAQVDELWS